MHRAASRRTGAARHINVNSSGQAEYIAGVMLEAEKPRKGSYATAHEVIARARARVTLRYFSWEQEVKHTYGRLSS